MHTKNDYTNLAPTKTVGVGIDLSIFKGDTNTPKTVVNCVYFCVCNLSNTGQLYLFMVGCIGATSVAPFPLSGKVNPVQLATHRLTSVSGVLIHFSKEVVMTTQSPCLSAQDLIQQASSASLGDVPLEELLPSVSPLLRYFIELILSDFDYSQHLKSDTAVAVRGMAAMVNHFQNYNQGE